MPGTDARMGSWQLCGSTPATVTFVAAYVVCMGILSWFFLQEYTTAWLFVRTRARLFKSRRFLYGTGERNWACERLPLRAWDFHLGISWRPFNSLRSSPFLRVRSWAFIFNPMSEVSRILDALAQGSPHAASQLLPLVYDELRRLAAQKLAGEKPGQTLTATALVHEAYLRLVSQEEKPSWDSRRHFFAAAAEAMRRILVENARRKRSLKRGGDLVRHDVEEEHLVVPEPREDLLALDEALNKLATTNPTLAELVQLRYFAGLTLPEV